MTEPGTSSSLVATLWGQFFLRFYWREKLRGFQRGVSREKRRFSKPKLEWPGQVKLYLKCCINSRLLNCIHGFIVALP